MFINTEQFGCGGLGLIPGVGFDISFKPF